MSLLNSIYRALRPGGALVLIDFHRIPGLSSSKPPGWVIAHVRAGQDVFRAEVESAGFRFETDLQVQGLVENYCMLFHRPEDVGE